MSTKPPHAPKPATEQTPPSKVPKHRSPNYPIMGLERALGKVGLVYNSDFKRHQVPLRAFMGKMDYSPDSSTGQQALASMKYFGLVDFDGMGDKRQARVSEKAAKVIANHADRATLLKELALNPTIHREVWDRFNTEDGLAPDATILQYLVWDRADTKFSEDAARSFLAQFKQTIQFANLGLPDKLPEAVSTIQPEMAGGATTPPGGGTPMITTQTNPQQSIQAFVQGLPLPVLMDDGTFRLVNIPRMTERAFQFFKQQLEAYKPAIIQPQESGEMSEESQK